MPAEVIDLLSSSPGNAQADPRSRASQSIRLSQKRIDELWNVIDNENQFLDNDGLAGSRDRGGLNVAAARNTQAITTKSRANMVSRQDVANRRICDRQSSRERLRQLDDHSKTDGWNRIYDSASEITTPLKGNDNLAMRNNYLNALTANHPESPIVISSPEEKISLGRGAHSRNQLPAMPPSSFSQNTPLSPRDRRSDEHPEAVSPRSTTPIPERRIAQSPIALGPDVCNDIIGCFDSQDGFIGLHPSERPVIMEENKKKGTPPSLGCLDVISPDSAHDFPACDFGAQSSYTWRTGVVTRRPGPRKSTLGQFFRVAKGVDGSAARKGNKPHPLAEVSGNCQRVAQKKPSTAKDEDDTILFTSDAIDPTTANVEPSMNRVSCPRTLSASQCDRHDQFGSDSEDLIEISVSAKQAFQRGTRNTSSSRTSTESIFDIANDGIASSSDIDRDGNYEFGNVRGHSENLSILEKIRKLNGDSTTIKRKGRRKAPMKRKLGSIEANGTENNDLETGVNDKRSTRPKVTTEERASRAAQRQHEKQNEKTARAKQRQAEKEERYRLKALENKLAEVNKRQNDRKKSALEMIVDLPASFNDQMKELAKQCFDDAKIKTSMVHSIVPNLITFRRKLTRVWDSNNYTFRPITQSIVQEPHVLCVLKAEEFARLVEAGVEGDNGNVDQLAQSINAAHPNFNQLYIIEGLSQFIKARANRTQREFANQVRVTLTQSQVPPPSQGRRRVRQHRVPDVDEEQIEDALQHLEVEHFAKISHTSSPAETITLVQRLTEYISTVRHSPEETTLADARTSFCLAAGQVSTGANACEAYIKMLQHPGAITESLAKDIARDYPGVLDLLRAFENKGPTALQDVERTRNGQTTQRGVERLGKALSEKLWATMTGDNVHASI